MLACRYGWSFNAITTLELEHLLPLMEVIKEKREEEAEEKLQTESYGAWQIIESVAGMLGSKKGRSFRTHLQSLGLWKSHAPKIENVKEFKKQAIAKAESIVAMYFKGGTKE